MKKPEEKRYKLSTEEREKIKNLQRLMADKRIENDALADSMSIELERVQLRLGLRNKVRDGFERIINFNEESFEVIVLDFNKKDLEKAKAAAKKEETEKKLKEKKEGVALN